MGFLSKLKRIFLLVVICCFVLISTIALGEPTNATIQIADTKDANGLWQWRLLDPASIVWDTAVTPVMPISNNIDDDSKQEWLIPHSTGAWGFYFILSSSTTQAKEYVLRWGYTPDDPDVPVLFGDLVTVTIAAPNAAVKVD